VTKNTKNASGIVDEENNIKNVTRTPYVTQGTTPTTTTTGRQILGVFLCGFVVQ
jgi:hypothetical protein